MRARTKARQRAVEALFEAEQRNTSVADVVSRNPDVNAYASELALTVESNQQRIDELLDTYSQEWTLHRAPAVDRAILRVAVAELLYKPEIDTAVIISQAVEIAGVLSTDESGSFINGLLASVALVRHSQSTL
ncbi:MAG: transcription antitermination factor NusB [Actinomycetes bacterium]